MAENEFSRTAKSLREAIVAQRTAAILRRVSEGASISAEAKEARQVLQRAVDFLGESLQGYSAARGEEGQRGFQTWVSSLRVYDAAFQAMVRGDMLQDEDDTEGVLDGSRRQVLEILKTGRSDDCKTARTLFENLANLRSEEVLATGRAPLERFEKDRQSMAG